MSHPRQRTSRLWHGDTLFQQVERIPYPPSPEPIPVGEARELRLPELIERVIHEAETA